MSNMTFFEKIIAYEIGKLQEECVVLRKLSTAKGFFEVFNEQCNVCGSEYAFSILNSTYKNLFGEYRYRNYTHFVNETTGNKNVNKLARSYLMAWFISKGFDSWQSFSPLVLHYFPEVIKAGLWDFYQDKIFTDDTLKKVEYVKQIIGE